MYGKKINKKEGSGRWRGEMRKWKGKRMGHNGRKQ